VKEDAPDHRKMKRLARLLKIPLPYANGIMERLWHHAGKYLPDGGIGRLSDEDITEACGMPVEADCSHVVACLIDAGFLDPMPSCRLFIHDWPEHCTHYTHNKIARQRLYFANGEAPSLRRLDHRYKAETELFYSVSAQSGKKSAQSDPVSAQSDPVSAQSDPVSAHERTAVSAQSGKKSAQRKPLRARERPTPKPTPKPTPSVATTSSQETLRKTGEQQQHCAPDSVVVAEALQSYGAITNASVRRFIASCKNGNGGYSADEIAAVVHRVGSTLGRGVTNPIGVLISQVPGLLPLCASALRRERNRPAPGTTEERLWLSAMEHEQDPDPEISAWARKILGREE
jgi:hypothetical protein